MSGFSVIASLGFAVLVVGTILLILHSIGSAVRRRHSERRQVIGRDGVWSTRIHWAHPKGGLGIAERVFASMPMSETASETETRTETEDDDESGASEDGGRFRLRDLAELGDLFDEGFLIVVGLIATLGLIVAVLVILLLAIELAFFLFLFSVLGGGRVLFRHPWTIEVVDPRGAKQLIEVEGLPETRETQIQIRQQIEAGTLKLAPPS